MSPKIFMAMKPVKHSYAATVAPTSCHDAFSISYLAT